jgi:hypothetical protein
VVRPSVLDHANKEHPVLRNKADCRTPRCMAGLRSVSGSSTGIATASHNRPPTTFPCSVGCEEQGLIIGETLALWMKAIPSYTLASNCLGMCTFIPPNGSSQNSDERKRTLLETVSRLRSGLVWEPA